MVFAGALLIAKNDRVRLPNCKESLREYIVDSGTVVVLAFLYNSKLLFERRFRYPLRRELLEETGYVASEWEYIGVIHPCIGYFDERIEIFAALGLHLAGDKQLDHNEFLEVVELATTEAKADV